MTRPLAWGFVAAFILAACGGDSSSSPDGSTGTDATAADAGPTTDAAFAEAPHAAQPQLVSLGGVVLANPKVRAVFFAGDEAMQAQIDDFDTQLAASSYWTATTAEYGVGTLTIAPTILSTDTPPTTTDGLTTWLTSNLDGTHADWGTLDPDTIYVVYLPANAGFEGACTEYGAFHDEVVTDQGSGIVYALVPRCAGGLANLTSSASHEIIEAATDPHVESTGAYGDVDAADAIWGALPGAETGDFCEFISDAYQPLVGDFVVARTWSNAAAAAGHDPCVPAVAGVYTGAAPVLPDSISFQGISTRGINIPNGTSKTITVQLFSDAPTGDEFSVEANDAAEFEGRQIELTFAWDKQTGTNGDVLKLTITRVHAATFGSSEFVITTMHGERAGSMWWALAME